MKIHEYNEMMAYLTRPAMAYGGRIGFNEGKLVEKAKNKFTKLKPGSIVDLQSLLNELGVEGKPARTRVGMRIKRLLGNEFPELKFLGAVEKLQAQETKLINFLQDRINKGETRFSGGLEEIKKLANVELKPTQLSKVMRANFPKTFIYRGIDMDQLPDALVDEIIELGKIENSATITKQLKNKLPFQAGKKLETTLVNNILDRAVDEGLLEEKIERRGGSALSATETTRRDNLIKDFIDRNPDMDNAHAIAKGVNAENPDLNISKKFVYDDKTDKGAMKRLGLEEIIKTRHAKIFPEVKALDKIIKQNIDLINSNMSPEAMKNELVKAYAKETNKSLVQAESELVTRMRKLGKVYAGVEQRYEKKLYNQIKIPKNYIGSKFQQTFIAVTDRAGKVSNINMAELLGLSKSDIKLIQGTSNMMNAFDFKVAGDHTDIKAMMKDFPNYRKNFTRIEYVKDSLNEFKRSYDTQINKLRKKAQGTLDPVLQKKYLEQAEALAAEFRNKTGYRIGTFGLDFSKSNTGLGRVTINPQTLRLPDLKNPYNKTLQTAMKNFETTGTPTDKDVIKFKDIDKRFINAKNSNETLKILEYANKNPKIAQQSLYLKALQKVPKIGKIATAVMKGTAVAGAGVLGMSTLANAANEPGQVPQGLSIGEKAAVGAGAAGAYAARKPIWKGIKAAGRAAGKTLAPLAVPLEAGFVLSDLKSGASTPEALANIVLAGGLVTAKERRDYIIDKYGEDVYSELQAYKNYGEDYMDMPQELPDEFKAIQAEADQYVLDLRQQRAAEFEKKSNLPKPEIDPWQAAEGGRAGFDGGGSPLQRLRQEIVDSMRPYAPGDVTEEQLQLIVKDITLDMTAEQAQASAKANFIKLFGMASGGRVGFDEGSKPKNPGRRAFLKGITALAALPLVGKYFKLGKVLERAQPYTGPAIEKIKGMPEWFPSLVKKLWNEGEDATKSMAFKERQIVKKGTLEGGDDVYMTYDLDSGNVSIEVGTIKGTSTKSGAYNKEYGLDYTKGEVLEKTGKKTSDEFGVAELEGRMDPGAADIDWEGKMTTVDDAMSDLTELEAFAKNKTTKQIHKKKGTKPKDVFPDYDYDPRDDY